MLLLYPILKLLLFFRNIRNSHGSRSYLNFEEEIYYKTPLFDLENMNLTLVASFPLDRSQFEPASSADAIGAAMAICQADLINQKLYPEVFFNGTINIAIQSYNSEDLVSQFSTIKLLSNSLYNTTTGKPLTSDGIFNLAGYFGASSSGVNRINAAAISGYGIPFINPGTIDKADVEDKFAIGNDAENRSFYAVRDTSLYTSFNVVLDVLKAYNWSTCSNIFQDNVLGFAAQQYVQTYYNVKKRPFFLCNKIFTPEDRDNTVFIQNLCDCWTKIDILRVIILWASPVVAFNLIREIKSTCSASKDFVFIVSGDSQPLPPQIYYNTEDFKSTLIIRPFGPLNVTSYLNECLEAATPPAKNVVNSLIGLNLEKQFRCFRKNDSNSDLPSCPKYLNNRTEPCLCSGFEYNPEENQYVAQNFFFADSISTYASAISLLQKNCSLVTELAQKSRDKEITKIDFCKLKTISPLVLGSLVTFVNFTGFTGEVSFLDALKNIREAKPYYLYTVKTTIAAAVLVGNFTIKGYFLNKSAIYLPNGNNTISEIVPQNPNIKYGAVAFFFGVMIFLLVLALIAFALLFYYYDHPIIRKNTPLMSLLVLTGTTIVLIGGIILCTDVNDASCIIFLFCFNIGLSLSLGGLIAKSYRLYRIFHNRSASAVVISDLSLLVIVFLITLYFVLLSIVFVIAGFQAYIAQSSSNKYYVFYQCYIDNQFWAIFLVIVNDVSLLLLRIVALGFAWVTRKIISTYSESRSVAALVVIYICLDFCFLPLFYSLRDGTDLAVYKAVIKSIYLCLATSLTLILLFYARFYQVYQYEMKSKKERSGNIAIE